MSLAYKISEFNRNRKWQLFLRHIRPDQTIKVLDVGFSDKEYSKTDNYIEKHYPYPENITALGIDTPKEFSVRYPEVKAVRYDGGQFPFAEKEFDVCWSNAVLEHTGDRSKQVQFLRETARVARKTFITTPNRLFPVEVHTRVPLLHFLPKQVFDRYLRLTGKEWAAGDYMNLLSYHQLSGILEDAGIKSCTIIRNRLLGFTLDFVIIF